MQGYSDFERSLLEDLTRARSVTDNITKLSDEESRLTGSLRSFFALAEAYPDLKAGANFRQLSEQLVGVEDALQYARRYYNGAVRDLNIAVGSFPSNLVAGLFGFRPEAFFEVESVAERAAPHVSLAISPAQQEEHK